MYQFFCEYPAGNQICGGRTIGRCYVCGRLTCRIHGRIEESRLFCLDCEPTFEGEGEKKVKGEGYQPDYTEKVDISPEEGYQPDYTEKVDISPDVEPEGPSIWDF